MGPDGRDGWTRTGVFRSNTHAIGKETPVPTITDWYDAALASKHNMSHLKG